MRAWLSACLASIALTACSGGGMDAAGTPRSFTRTDSAVTTTPGVGVFTSTKTVTLSNDDGGAMNGDVTFDNAAGAISATAGSNGSYQVQVTLTATAPTQAEAEAALASMTVTHRDALGGGTLYLDTAVHYGSFNDNNASRTATVAPSLPPALRYRLDEQGDSGSLSSSGLNGSSASLNAASGGATLSGTWDSASIGVDSGSISVSGDIPRLQASSASGTMTATLSCVRSTHATFDGDSGAINVTVTQQAGIGFDLTADTMSGSATITVAGTTPSGTQTTTHAHYRSANFATANPQIVVDGQTASGSVSIHD